MASASLGSVPDVSEKPNQPLDFAIPKRQFGKTKGINRSFQAQWFQKFRWLHYDQARDLAFCHTCVSVVKSGKMKSTGNVDSAFISRGFYNWKDASGEKGAFNSHEHSKCHQSAVELVITPPRTAMDVGEMMSSAHSEQ